MNIPPTRSDLFARRILFDESKDRKEFGPKDQVWTFEVVFRPTGAIVGFDGDAPGTAKEVGFESRSWLEHYEEANDTERRRMLLDVHAVEVGQ